MARRKNNRIIPRSQKRIMRLRESNALLQKSDLKEDIFKVDNLEERMLLSADPILGPGYHALLVDRQDESTQTPIVIQDLLNINQQGASASYDVSVQQNSNVIDLADLEKSQNAFDSALKIGDQDILGGSGTLNVDLVNEGTVAPGYSPGIQNVSSYTQLADATLEIEIAGSGVAGAADGFDQLNIVNAADLDGNLAISFLNGYKPKVGDSFEIITFDSIQGKFSDATGLYGFNDDFYLELVQDEHKISLVVKEVISGDALTLVNSVQTQSDTLGNLLNYKYFNDPYTSIEFSGNINLSDDLYWNGDFVFSLESQASDYTL
ncbi:LEPR-XLL domain-containing protein, partial [bacterium]|nr:LEPR-XLL domain-containing protein [bacterium]